MIKKLSIFFAIIILTQSTRASENPASTGLSFLKSGAGARAVAMGEAFAALVDDASGTFWNPAGLAHLQRAELIFTHNEWLQDITNEYFAIGFSIRKNVVGISFLSNSVGGIERRVNPTAEPLGIVYARDVMFGISYARFLDQRFSLGTSIKFLYEKIYVESCSGAAFDVGLQYQTTIHGLKTGLSWQNIGYMTKLKYESSKLPQLLRLGLAYQLPVNIMQGGIILTSDWVKIFNSTSHINLGLEFGFKSFFVFRFGYQTGWDDKGIQGGFGIMLRRYRLDYAYVPFKSDLGNSHRISFGMQL